MMTCGKLLVWAVPNYIFWDSYLTKSNLVRRHKVDLQVLEAGSEGQVVLNTFASHLVEKDRAYLLYFSFKGKVADYECKDFELDLAEGQNIVDDVPLGQATQFN